MAFQLKNQNDIKIFILYLLMNVPRPLSYNELNDIVVQDELVSSLDFAECIAQLEDTGNVAFTPALFRGRKEAEPSGSPTREKRWPLPLKARLPDISGPKV